MNGPPTMPRDPHTLGGFIDRGDQLWLYCNRQDCRRQLNCDVYDLAERFGADTVCIGKTNWKVRCAACGSNDVSMLTPGESRPAEAVRREGPSNMRRDRSAAERERALAMISPECRRDLGAG